MNKYHIIFYFSNTLNFETNVKSELEINDFIIEFNNKIQNSHQNFVNFVGDGKKFTINMDNVLFYTVEEIEEVNND